MSDGVDDIVLDLKHRMLHILARIACRVRECDRDNEADVQKVILLEEEIKIIEGGENGTHKEKVDGSG